MGSLGPHNGWLLRLFGAHVTAAFGHTPYQVGSSLTEKAVYRDVDVRLILPDDEYDAKWDLPTVRWMHEMAWTALGEKLTRLPIDFQIQRETDANAEFEGPRSALIVRDLELPVVRVGKAA
jgi:hypothetical protein